MKFNIKSERLWNDMMEFGQIGRGEDGGVTRTSFDEADMEARGLFLKLLEKSGLNPGMDAAGNIFGEITGEDPELPVLLIGSHLDTVRSGGRFDGATGVLMAVEVLRTMQENGIKPARTVKIVSFTDEEGARFDYAFVGSMAATGSVAADELQRQLAAAMDGDGISYAEAMRNASHKGGHFSRINPDSLEQAQIDKAKIKAYLEVHIEQGKVLENKNLGVGIVSGITGGEWSDVTISGEAGHAGTIGMTERRDALTAAGECLLAIESIAKNSGGSVATVGKLEVKPGSSNVIPGRVDFTLDIRDISDERRNQTSIQIYDAIRDIVAGRGLTCEVTPVQSLSSMISSAMVTEAMKAAFQEVDYPTYSLPSGAAHDAMVMGNVCEVGMLFVRSKDGISHHPAEWSSQEDVALGCEILYRTVAGLL
ncbi:Zn-dependent hydrolase [Aneurinibacillus tyrosinisolvens]|uniref:Zn-dependent hydrolase n=1 Tax=Aneurinibacillus tyrosinisolvens TaxID=1443435 RepID=UPI00063F7BA4|nr:Zn-dependent hydrolase [Aneurinibacillus tyrosinisolvens]